MSTKAKSRRPLDPNKPIQVRPREDYRLAGCDFNLRLDKTKVYTATPATNQPDWEKKGKVFVSFNDDGEEPSILLDSFDYEIVDPRPLNNSLPRA